MQIKKINLISRIVPYFSFMLHKTKKGGGDTSSHSAGPNLFNLSLLAPPLQAIVTSR